jgi:transcriptional regulator with XRE-family HTH domain
MTAREKIKTFRNIQEISQNISEELAGIDGTTIHKYELVSRNPKPDQVLKISNALGVSINVFTDFDIDTISDVLTLLFKMDEQIDKEIDSRLSKFAKVKKLQENPIAFKDAFPSEETFQHEVMQMKETYEQIKQHLVDTNRVVKKGISGISVKIYPENTP